MNWLQSANKRYLSFIVWGLRLTIGATFILSGLVKAIDLWGFLYKIEQYFGVWGIDCPRALELSAATIISTGEFILGAFLATGSYKRTSSWILLAMMGGMLPLSAYIAIANPVADCGCFGDFIIISNTMTFVKNLFLTAGLAYLAVYNNQVRGIYNKYIQWMQGAMLLTYILYIGMQGYTVQPLLDFRPYKIGTQLVKDREEQSDNEELVADIRLTYVKNGVKKVFTMDSLPDSTWTFVDRVIPATLVTDEESLAIYDSGNDVTSEVIANQGDEFILFIPELSNVDIAYTYLINELSRKVQATGGMLIAVIGTGDDGVNFWRDMALASYPIYTAEDTAIKEIVRGNLSLVYLKDGVIKWKRTLSSMNRAEILKPVEQPDWMYSFYIDGKRLFIFSTGILLLGLVALWGLNRSVRVVKWRIYRRKQK